MRKVKLNKPLVESSTPPSSTNVYWIDVDESTGKVSTIKKFLKGQWIEYLQFVPEPPELEPFVGPANNLIWYMTIDGLPFDYQHLIELLSLNSPYPYSGPQVISNVFDPSKNVYIITFDSAITKVGAELTDDELPIFDAPVLTNPDDESPKFLNIWLPQSVTTLKYLAYFNTTAEEIKLPKGVTTFGYMTMANNVNLKKLILPNTITKLPVGTIFGSPKLQIIEFLGTVAQWINIEKEIHDDNTWIIECPLVSEVQCIDGNVPIL